MCSNNINVEGLKHFFQRNDGNISMTVLDEDGSETGTSNVPLFDVFSDQVASITQVGFYAFPSLSVV